MSYNGISREGMILNYEVLAKQFMDLDREHRCLCDAARRVLDGDRDVAAELSAFLDPGIEPDEKAWLIDLWTERIGT